MHFKQSEHWSKMSPWITVVFPHVGNWLNYKSHAIGQIVKCLSIPVWTSNSLTKGTFSCCSALRPTKTTLLGCTVGASSKVTSRDPHDDPVANKNLVFVQQPRPTTDISRLSRKSSPPKAVRLLFLSRRETPRIVFGHNANTKILVDFGCFMWRPFFVMPMCRAGLEQLGQLVLAEQLWCQGTHPALA